MKRIKDFPMTRILLGIAIVVGAVALGEWVRTPIFSKITRNPEVLDGLTAILVVGLALTSYIFFFRLYEKRQIRELKASDFGYMGGAGFLLGLVLQSVLIGILYLTGDYSILVRHPLSDLFPGLADALVAGFVAEILLRGILFRLAEEKLGTPWTLVLFVLLFGFLHSGTGATFFSVLSVSMEAGLLASVTFVYSRSLWFPIFLHFAKDYAEPSIFGGINTGISLKKSLFTPGISGNPLLTGGPFGPSNSLVAAFLYLVVAVIFLVAAKKEGRFILPFWKQKYSRMRMGKAQL
jgi:membrane protease YdiL (CAAX protease family)